jgi:hypothetical protein
VRPPGLVGDRVEEVLAVVVPREPVAGLGYLHDVVAGVEVADADGEHLAARGVREVGQTPVVRADVEAAETEVVVPLGLDVLVEQDLLVRRRRPGVDRTAQPVGQVTGVD